MSNDKELETPLEGRILELSWVLQEMNKRPFYAEDFREKVLQKRMALETVRDV